MAAIAVIGAQWGDEAKGKVVHFLAGAAHLAVRFNGGANAGHTVEDAYGTARLHLVPAGALRPGCVGVIAHGVVVDPQVLDEELAELQQQGRPPVRFCLSSRAHLVLPHHRVWEELQGTAGRIGTTRRGIGPAYQERAARSGLRVGDLADMAEVRARLGEAQRNLRRWFGQPGFEVAEVAEQLARFYQAHRERIQDTRALVAAALDEGRTVLFEGAQGTLLDVDLGTYPFVTSSTTTVHGVGWGTGVATARLDRVVGVAKAYVTRVGEGPLPTELRDGAGDHLQQRGREYGATTGRPRRCGWLDLPALRYACRVNEFTELVLTKLDVLGGLPEIKVCTAYRVGGRRVDEFPDRSAELATAEPVYESLPGWTADLRSARVPSQLPQAARDYLHFVEEAVGTEVSMVGVGPGEEEMVER
ncbi:MAG: adenylosuccinate synthase [Candidatus Bipolaricaulaceae bacterium]